MTEIKEKAIGMLELLLNEYDSHSMDFEICLEFIEYLKDKDGKNIRANGIKPNTEEPIICDFGKTNRHKPAY